LTKKLFAQMYKPLLRFEVEGTRDKPLRIARSMIPEQLFKEPRTLTYFSLSGTGAGHSIDLRDQLGQAFQTHNFADGDATVLGPFLAFLNALGDSTQLFIEAGPGYGILCPLANGRGCRHVEFDGTHLLLPKTEVPMIDIADATPTEVAALRNPKLTRKMVVRYQFCDYVIFTKADLQVVPSNVDERREHFPEVHNLIELERDRQFTARTVTHKQLQKAIDDASKK
jgi:hypothetical protein